MMYPEESMMKPEPIARWRPMTTPVFPRSLCSSAPYPVTRICTTLGETFLTRASTEELSLRRDSVSDVDWAATAAEQISEAAATKTTPRKCLRAEGNLGRKLPGRFDIGISSEPSPSFGAGFAFRLTGIWHLILFVLFKVFLWNLLTPFCGKGYALAAVSPRSLQGESP